MQGDFRSFQNEKQFVFVFMQSLKGKVQELIIGFLFEDFIEEVIEADFILFVGGLFVGLQFIVEVPDLFSDGFEDFTSVFIGSDSLLIDLSAWIQQRAWRKMLNCPASSLTMTKLLGRPWASTAPMRAASVAIRIWR